MLLLQKTAILCLAFVEIFTNEKISFKNVDVVVGSKSLIHVTSSPNLKTVIPPGESEVSVRGPVPILYEDSVADLDEVKYLDFDEVSLEVIHAGAFKNLSNIRKLSVQRSKIKELREGTFSQISAYIIRVSYNPISKLQPRVFKNSKITDLYFNFNEISKIPNQLFENVTIDSTLSFEFNKLRYIEPDAFVGLSGLERLFLSGNKLEKISSEVLNFPDLTDLYLSHNLITFLHPGDLKNLPQLTHLRIDSNKLKEIEDGIFSNSKIRVLSLGENEITFTSSAAFSNMTKLYEFFIDRNYLTRWDENWFRTTPEIRVLDFSYNEFEEIPDKAFKNLPIVWAIKLKKNKIATIPANLGTNFSVDEIDFSGNNIKCIEGDLEVIFRNVKKVNFENNPWNDDCENKVKFYQRSNSEKTI